MILKIPKYQFNIKKDKDKTVIYDELRRKFVRLTPEEWVRQNYIRFLIEQKKCPAGRIAIETSIRVHGIEKRVDIALYDDFSNVLLIVECKAQSVPVTQTVFEQAARYNLQLDAQFLAVSNGIEHFCCFFVKRENRYLMLEDIPEYEKMKEYTHENK